jgi:hypothetical protein
VKSGGAVLAVLALSAFVMRGAWAQVAPVTMAQSDYIENCGGCHGFDGNSAPADIPVLRDRVGYFMCTPEGRNYLIRLPNVAHSRIEDPRELAALMNFVVYAIGGKSAPAGARPFKGAEVALLRKQAMTTISLIAEREMVVAKMIKNCGAPESLRTFYPGQPSAGVLGMPSALEAAK